MNVKGQNLPGAAEIGGRAGKRANKTVKVLLRSHLSLVCVLHVLSGWFVAIIAQEPQGAKEFTILEGGFNDTIMRCSSTLGTAGFLLLTPDSLSNSSPSSGRCLYYDPVRLLDPKKPTEKSVLSFSTSFTFSIDGTNQNQNRSVSSSPIQTAGFAFVIVADNNLAANEAESGNSSQLQYLGMLNETSNNKNSSHTFGVEFDIYNPLFTPMFNDPPYDHVGINFNSMNSTVLHEAGTYYFETCPPGDPDVFVPTNLSSRAVFQAWIDYDSVDKSLRVYLGTDTLFAGKPWLPLLQQYGVDLSYIIEDTMSVGFTSAGVGSELFIPAFVYAWSFNTSGPAESVVENPVLDSFSWACPPPPQSSWTLRKILVITIPTSVGIICVLLIVGVCLFQREKKAIRKKYRLIEMEELEYGPIKYTYKELTAATHGFDPAKILGAGGCGTVYLGVLPMSGTTVAVKRMSTNSKQTEREFMAEIRIIGRLRHRNLVQLAGWCHERGEMVLVYEYMSGGSLDQYLFSSSNDGRRAAGGAGYVVQWKERFDILVGVATALLYLHEEWEQRVVHRDVKASNVMLDSDFNARLGDFGLARSYEHSEAPQSTMFAGTPGYLAPEATHTLKATPETDVFSFGVVALEVACGRPALDNSRPTQEVVLVRWVSELCKMGRLLDAVDPRLGEKDEKDEVLFVLEIGLLCTHPDPASRPSMRRVLHYLKREISITEFP